MSSESINWEKGYSSRYYLTFVDINTWGDMSKLDITGGSINRSTDELMEAADIDCVNYDRADEECLIRIWLDASQEGELSHIPLFTGWATSPGKNIDGQLVTNTLQCYSVLKPAQDVLLPPGWYAPLETDSKELIKELLKPTKANIDFYPDAVMHPLKESLIAEENENNLSMAELILYAVGWQMHILGDGTIYIFPKVKPEDKEKASFDYLHNDILEQSIKVSFDWYSCPNVFRAIVDDTYAVARDNSDSIFSIKSRGREIWAQESNCDLNENESPSEYAVRRLKELQTVYKTVEYDRRFQPDVYPADLIRLNYPAQDLRGKYQVLSQTITLGYNAKTSEEVTFINE